MANRLYNYTPEEIQQIVNNSNSFKDVLDKVGMRDTGSDYLGLKRFLEENNIDISVLSKNRKKLYINTIKKIKPNIKIPIEKILIEKSTYNNGSYFKNRLLKEGLKKYIC